MRDTSDSRPWLWHILAVLALLALGALQVSRAQEPRRAVPRVDPSALITPACGDTSPVFPPSRQHDARCGGGPGAARG